MTRGVARRHAATRSEVDQDKPALHRELGGKRLATAREGKRFHTVPLAATEAGLGLFKRGAKRAERSAPNLCELPWPLPDVRCPPAVPAALLARLRCASLLRAAGPPAWPSSNPWKPPQQRQTRLPLRPAQRKGRASIPASWWSVMTPCASLAPMPVGRSVRARRSGMAAARFQIKVSGSAAKGPTSNAPGSRTTSLA